jgi:hypothetical protein
MKGKDITIPKGTEITAYINGDIPLDPKRFRPQDLTASGSAIAPTVFPAVESAPSTIELKSDPDGAEISN